MNLNKIDDLSSASFFQTAHDGTWPPQLAFDLNSAATLHTLIPTALHPAHMSLQHQLQSAPTALQTQTVGHTQVATANSAAPPQNACSTAVFHVGLGQYVSEQEHFKSLFTV